MVIFLLIIRLFLAVVLLTAGVAKLVDHDGSCKAMLGFGVPESFASVLSWILVLAELSLAIALVPSISFQFAAIGALALFSLFSIGVGVSVAKGKKTTCHCFGQLHSAPIGWKTIARNVVLTILAAILAWQRETAVSSNFDSWMNSLTNPERWIFAVSIAATVLLTTGLFLLLKVLNQQKELTAQIEEIHDRLDEQQLPQSTKHREIAFPSSGLPIGAPAPAFTLSDIHGEQHSLTSILKDGKSALLLFSSPSCGPCETLLPDVAKWQREYADRLQIVLISAGTEKENRAKYSDEDIDLVLLQQDSGVEKSYEAHWTPVALTVRPNGTIDSKLAMGSDAIKSLVAETVKSKGLPLLIGNNGNGHDHNHASAMIFGQPAPRFSLKNLDGDIVSLSDFEGKKFLVVFWNPECSFCLEMTGDLKIFEATSSNESPQLLFISRGTPEANRNLGLSSTILLDQATVVLKQYGASGTPSGILIDEDGKAASLLEVGAPNVLALLGIKTKAKSAI